MYIFALWNQSPMPAHYVECLTALRERYPTLVVLPYTSVDPDPRGEGDVEKLRILLSTSGSALYLDLDTMPGPDTWTGDGVVRCCAINCRGGMRDLSVLYKPEGREDEIRAMIEYGGNDKPTMRYLHHVQTWAPIAGYPDNKYFQHLNLSA